MGEYCRSSEKGRDIRGEVMRGNTAGVVIRGDTAGVVIRGAILYILQGL
jgi:hypothetical protein